MTRQTKLKRLEKDLEFVLDDSADVFVLFVDLCGSTEFKRQNQAEFIWVTRQLLFLRRVAEFVKRYNGIVIKTIGDEVMAIFQVTTLPEEILKCAIEIVQSLEGFKLFQGKQKIEAKVSIDFGLTYNGSIIDQVIYDPIGTPVDRCARLNSVTKDNEITFSQDFMNVLLSYSTEGQLLEKYGYTTRKEDLKGISQTIVFSIQADAK